jgi:hypothetical protein
MNRTVIGLAAVASLAGMSIARSKASDVQTDRPIVMEKFEITVPGLDLNPDKHVDSFNPKTRHIIYDLGNVVPAGDILACFTCEQLEDTYRPVYRSMDEFAEGVRHEGWVVREERDLEDFYVAVMSTPSGHLAGVYYAKTRNGEKLQNSAKIELFVADAHLKQIVPESNVFSLDQRIRYLVATSSVGGAGLTPMSVTGSAGQVKSYPGGSSRGGMVTAAGTATREGSMLFHEGELFLMSRKTSSFVCVFRAGPQPANSTEIAFSDWFDSGDGPSEGFDRVHVNRNPVTH